MVLVKCPECKCIVDDEDNICKECGFDLLLYRQAYEKIYNQKMENLNKSEADEDNSKIEYKMMVSQSHAVHRPRCPICNSEDLTRITSLDKVINIAIFGLLGNKRKYQWHCNNCNSNW